jgi:hypothetical protein
MKRLTIVSAKQTVGLLIFIAASVLPLYSQESTPTPKAQAPAQTSEEPKQPNEVNPQTTAQQPATQKYVFPTKRERFNRYVKSTVGPLSLARTAFSAGINQWRDNPEEWEQGASGYGKRFASSFGRNVIQQTVIYGLDSAMGLDTGFKRSTRKGFGPRAVDALLENITSCTRTGKRVFSVPRVSGVYASKIISAETWYPSRYNYKDGLKSGTRSILTGFGMNLVREFVIRW